MRSDWRREGEEREPGTLVHCEWDEEREEMREKKEENGNRKSKRWGMNLEGEEERNHFFEPGITTLERSHHTREASPY